MARPELFIADCLSSQNHAQNRDCKIPVMKISISVLHTAADIPECMSIEDIQRESL